MMTPSLAVSLAALALCLCFFVYCRFYLRRRTGQERILAEFRDEVDGILAEIDEKTDRDSRLVEERIKRLRAILEDVDKRIAVYVRELDRRGSQERAYAELGKKRLRGLENLSSSPPVSPQETPSLFPPEPASPEAEENRPIFVQLAEEAPSGAAPPEESVPPPRSPAEQAMELARAGFSTTLIASRLGLSVSEVELALAVAERKNSRRDDTG